MTPPPNPLKDVGLCRGTDSDTLPAYIEALASFANGEFYDWLLRNGKSYPIGVGENHGALRECYANAANLAARDSDYTYVEGYAIASMGLPVEHAWVEKGGEAIEVTWPLPGLEYFGVAMDADCLWGVLRQTMTYGVFCNLWQLEDAWRVLESLRVDKST